MKTPDAAMEVREEFGFRRNVCACRKCSLWCEHVPGALVPSDLERLIPDGDDPFQWAEVHLRASPGFQPRQFAVWLCVFEPMPANKKAG